jgi:hypothetical protein
MVITIEKINDTTFKVTVTSRQTTTHTVTVTPEYKEKLAGPSVATETLVEKAFEFLLGREPNTSILHQFDLKAIQTYFPEYEGTLR